LLSAKGARQLFAVHRWTGLVSGIFILFLSLTGAGLVFITEIDRLLNRSLLVTEPAGQMISPEQAVAAATAAYPKAKVSSIELPINESSVFTLNTNRINTPQEVNQIMVNPYSGAVTGTRMYSSSFKFILRQMHLRFFYFKWQGRVFVGFLGLVLLLSTITGLIIYNRFIRALPHWWSIRKQRGFQISTSDWHKLVGIVALAFNLVIAVTGAVLGLENLSRYSDRVGYAIHPTPAKDSIPEPPATLDGMVPVSAALAEARAAIPGFKPLAINLPRAEKSHYIVRGDLEGKIAMEGASEVGIHAMTGEPFYRKSAREVPTITKAYNWMDPLHFGYWGGVVTKILYLIFGLTTGFLSISGFIVWYMKRFRRTRAAAPVARAATAASLILAAASIAAPVHAQTVAVGKNVQVSAAHAAAGHYEVLVAADPNDASKMIVGSFIYPPRGTTAGSIVYATRDGGKTWTPTLQGDILFNTSDPAPAYGPDGIAYYTASNLGPPPSPREKRMMKMFRSRDGGFKWETMPEFTYSDRQYITVDVTGGKYHGRIYVNGNNRVPYGVSDYVVFRSSDQGATWKGPTSRPGFGKNSAGNMGNSVVASDGTLIGLFSEGDALRVVLSADGAETFTPAIDIDSQYVPAGNRKGGNNNVVGLPYMAIDPGSAAYRDHLYVVWGDRRTGTSRIFFASSSDKGKTWTESRPIDDRAASDSSDAFMPTIAVNKDGVVGVMWYDRTAHADNIGWDARFAASLDGGRTFLPSVKVSEQGNTFGRGAEYSGLGNSVARAKPEEGGGINLNVSLNTFTFLGGDTNGLVAAANGLFYPVWVDNRTGVPQVWTAPVSVSRTATTAFGTDVTDKIMVDVVEKFFDVATSRLTTVVRLRNTSGQPLRGPFLVQLRDVSSQLGTMQAAPGQDTQWTFTDSSLSPGAQSAPRTWQFVYSNPQPFRSGNRYRLGLLEANLQVLSDPPSTSSNR
jgi:uncharacterized iron-regulated membrane protein